MLIFCDFIQVYVFTTNHHLNNAISLDFRAQNFPFNLSVLNTCLNSMSLYFALKTVENNKNKKSVKFQGDMLNFYDFIQVYVFTTNHHLN